MDANVPPDVNRQLLLNLPYADILNVCMTNQYYNDVVCNDDFWALMINRDFNIPVANQPAVAINTRTLYHVIMRLQGLPLGRNDINAVLVAMGYPA